MPQGTGATPKENTLGKESAVAMEDFYGVVDRPAWNLRLLSAAAPLQAVINRPDIEYKFKVLDTQEINAMALPGGWVYVSRGLMDFLDNDNELQGVLAHEMAHVDLGHGLGIYKRQMRSMVTTILAILASRDPQVIQAVGAATQAMFQGYGRSAENEADIQGLKYLISSKTPVSGFLSFMDRLQVEENHRPNFSKEYFFTHAPTDERIQASEQFLKDRKISVPPRKYTPRITLYPKGGALPSGEVVGLIATRDHNRWLVLSHDPFDESTGFSRAEKASNILNGLIKKGLRSYEIQSGCHNEKRCYLKYRDQEILSVTTADARLYGQTPEELTQAWKNTLRRVLWQDFVENRV